jgi:hypothetical protein
MYVWARGELCPSLRRLVSRRLVAVSWRGLGLLLYFASKMFSGGGGQTGPVPGGPPGVGGGNGNAGGAQPGPGEYGTYYQRGSAEGGSAGRNLYVTSRGGGGSAHTYRVMQETYERHGGPEGDAGAGLEEAYRFRA